MLSIEQKIDRMITIRYRSLKATVAAMERRGEKGDEWRIKKGEVSMMEKELGCGK